MFNMRITIKAQVWVCVLLQGYIFCDLRLINRNMHTIGKYHSSSIHTSLSLSASLMCCAMKRTLFIACNTSGERDLGKIFSESAMWINYR